MIRLTYDPRRKLNDFPTTHFIAGKPSAWMQKDPKLYGSWNSSIYCDLICSSWMPGLFLDIQTLRTNFRQQNSSNANAWHKRGRDVCPSVCWRSPLQKLLIFHRGADSAEIWPSSVSSTKRKTSDSIPGRLSRKGLQFRLLLVEIHGRASTNFWVLSRNIHLWSKRANMWWSSV